MPKILIKFGYNVDCSVTPLRSWKNTLGDPKGCGGSDYSFHPNQPYWITTSKEELKDSLLEIPVTIISQNNFINYLINNPMLSNKWIINKISNYIKPIWLRPNGNNLDSLKKILSYKLKYDYDQVMLTLHSSELMPAGSPVFKSKKDIEKLYSHLNDLFSVAKDFFQGGTLSDYYNYFLQKRKEN